LRCSVLAQIEREWVSANRGKAAIEQHAAGPVLECQPSVAVSWWRTACFCSPTPSARPRRRSVRARARFRPQAGRSEHWTRHQLNVLDRVGPGSSMEGGLMAYAAIVVVAARCCCRAPWKKPTAALPSTLGGVVWNAIQIHGRADNAQEGEELAVFALLFACTASRTFLRIERAPCCPWLQARERTASHRTSRPPKAIRPSAAGAYST
jgi:hypothetical protein